MEQTGTVNALQEELPVSREQAEKLDDRALLQLYRQTGDQELKWMLALRYTQLVRRIALQASGMYSSFAQLDDIIQEGLLVLLNAVDKFDPEKNVKFETYVSTRLRGMIVDLARRHLHQAGLDGRVHFAVADACTCQMDAPRGAFLCNPPYGERLGDRKACEALYHQMGLLLRRHPGWSLSAITSHPGFERCFGGRADKKRRFYNGRLECEFMTFLSAGGKQRKP